jgi:hypothetical protein
MNYKINGKRLVPNNHIVWRFMVGGSCIEPPHPACLSLIRLAVDYIMNLVLRHLTSSVGRCLVTQQHTTCSL